MASSNEITRARAADSLRESIYRHIRYTLVRDAKGLKPAELLVPVSLAVRDHIVDRMLRTEERFEHLDSKRLYYLSMEFLIGRSLGDNLINLGMFGLCREVLAGMGYQL